MSRPEDEEDDFRPDDRRRRRPDDDPPPWRRRRDDDSDSDSDSDARRPRDRYEDDDRRPGPPPKNYLTESILVLIFCAWPLAIPALVYSNQVESHWARGDYRQARRASVLARRFAIWAALAPLIIVGALLTCILGVAIVNGK